MTTITSKRVSVNGGFANVYETSHYLFGFTETGFVPESFKELTGRTSLPVKQLKQTHSNIVHFSSDIEAGDLAAESAAFDTGDGIIVDEPGTLAIIKTADCTPLFFRDKQGTIGGVLHIGWRGLQKEIEKKALNVLKSMPERVEITDLEFLLGPAIESDCYEVGPELYDAFADTGFRSTIFYPSPQKKGKYLLDVKGGVRCSLIEEGIPAQQISDSGLCTFCENKRFPSYRREKSGGRILNFFMLK